jgi:glucosamine kinase
MIIIADSGSTKTDWKIVGKEEPQMINTMGFNPVYHDDDLIYRETVKGYPEDFPFEEAEKVFFYGAGCWDKVRKETVAIALRRAFKNATVEVDHDLLGAARAACGKQPGIVCIIGTGSNSCLYDGELVIDNVTNLGYLVGDESSGAFLGKELIRTYFYRELPPDLVEAFEDQYPGGKAAILNNVYNKPQPNVYLASFTKFLSEHKDHIFIQKLLYQGLSVFVDRHIRKYRSHFTLPVHFIGSVAFYFQNFLTVILQERDMQPGIFLQKPIDKLVEFHTAGKFK